MSSKASTLRITEDLFEDRSRHISVICPNEIISNDCLALDFFWYVLNGISAQGINFLNELHHHSDCYAAAVYLMTNLYLFQLFSRRQEPHTEFIRTVNRKDFVIMEIKFIYGAACAVCNSRICGPAITVEGYSKNSKSVSAICMSCGHKLVKYSSKIRQ